MNFLRPFIRRSLTTVGNVKVNRLASFCYSTKSERQDEDVPIRYTTSPANQWKARQSIQGHSNDLRLWYEPVVLWGSFLVFMLYFCVLREENDIDERLSDSLYNKIDGLEEYQLKALLLHNERHNISNVAVHKRLREIEAEKNIVN